MNSMGRGCVVSLSLAISGILLTAGQQNANAQGASQNVALDEVVVTSRRREENLQDLPLSIAAFNADALLAQGVDNVEDIGEMVPNVTLTQGDRANHTRVVIRGIGGGSGDVTAAFGSAMYIDGHYIPSSLGGYMSTVDIERVEVLRGPQGTLFGKNVTGGAVNIISKKPDSEFDSSVTMRFGEHGEAAGRGMLNLPITDNLYSRFSVAKEVTDGYYYNRNLDKDVGAKDLTSFGAGIRWEPGAWTVDFTGSYAMFRDDNSPIQCNNMDGSSPPWGGGTGNIERIYTGANQAFKAVCNEDAALGTFVNSSDKDTYNDIDQLTFFSNVEWSSEGPIGIFDELGVKAKASYRRFEYDYLYDSDGSYFAISAIGTSPDDSSPAGNKTKGGELILEGTFKERLNFTVGVNLFEEIANVGTTKCRDFFYANGMTDPGNTLALDCPYTSGTAQETLPAPLNRPIDLPWLINQGAENDSTGVFANISYAFNDRWSLDAGLRWTEDKRSIWNFEGPITGCSISDNPQARSVGNTSAQDADLCDFSFTVSYDSIMNEGFLNTQSGTFSATTPMLSISRHLTPGDFLDSGMIYALYSEGFLTGGFNTEVTPNAVAAERFRSYGPESVKNYELGFKGTLFGGKLQIMSDVFYMDYSDKQENISIANPDFLYGISDPMTLRQNIGAIEIYGVEFEMRARPWEGGYVSLDIGYLENKYSDYSFPNPSGVGFIDRSNTAIADLTPEWTLNIGVEHEFVLPNQATLTPRLSVHAQDDYDYVTSVEGAPASPCMQDAYAKVGARMTYRPAQGGWQASLYGENITDEEIYEYCARSRGVYIYRHERPMHWGIEFVSRWGASAR